MPVTIFSQKKVILQFRGHILKKEGLENSTLTENTEESEAEETASLRV